MAGRSLIVLVLLVASAHAQTGGGTGTPKAPIWSDGTTSFECPKVTADGSAATITKSGINCTLSAGTGTVLDNGGQVGGAADFESTVDLGAKTLLLPSGTADRPTLCAPGSIYLETDDTATTANGTSICRTTNTWSWLGDVVSGGLAGGQTINLDTNTAGGGSIFGTAGASNAANYLELRAEASGILGTVGILAPLVQLNSAGAAPELRFFEDGGSGANYVGIKALGTLSSNATYTLPPTVPSSSGQVLAATTAGVMSWSTAGGAATNVNLQVSGAACDGAISSSGVVSGTDDTSAIQTILNAAPPGATVTIPSGKLCKLTGKITLKNGVRFMGEGGAGLVLSTRQCTAGVFVGGSCHANADCTGADAPWACCTGAGAGHCGDAECYNNGASTTGLCAGTTFAPVAATSYPVIDAVSSGNRRDIAVQNLAVHAMQISPYNTCTGSGARAAEMCESNADCTANVTPYACCTGSGTGTCTTDVNLGCPTNGACSAAPDFPSGPGKINPVDLSNNVGRGLIRELQIVDLRVSDQLAKIGTGTVSGVNLLAPYEGICCSAIAGGCANTPPGSGGQACDFNYLLGPIVSAITDGIVCTGQCLVTDNILRPIAGGGPTRNGIDLQATKSEARSNTVVLETGGTQIGIKASTYATIASNIITFGYNATTPTGISTGINAIVTGNTISSNGVGTTYVGITTGASSHVNTNVCLLPSSSGSVIGIKAASGSEYTGNDITTSASNTTAMGFSLTDVTQARIIGNYVSAFNCLRSYMAGVGAGLSNITFGFNRCYLGAGTKLVIAGGPGWKVIGNYLAWGNGASVPLILLGNNTSGESAGSTAHAEIDGNTFFSENATPVGIQIPDIGKRCDGGSNVAKICVNDNTTDCPGATCPSCCDAQAHGALRVQNNEFLTLGKAVDLSALVTASNTSLTSAGFTGNIFSIGATGIDFPTATSTKLSGIGIAANNFQGTTTPLDADWSWTYGDVSANTPPISMTAAGIAVGTCGNGNSVYCSDCDDFAQAGGSGAQVTCVNGKWVATTTDWPLQNVREWNLQKIDDIAGTGGLSVQGIDETVNTATGTPTDLVDTTGTYWSYPNSGANPSNSGWKSARFTLTRTDQAPVFTSVIKTGADAFSTTTRIVAGLVSADATGSKTPTTIHVAALAFDTTGSADTKWMCMTCSGAACTRTATSVTVATNTRYALKIACSATQCDCYINGKLEISNTATLPTSTQSLGYQVEGQGLVAAVRSIRISKIDMVHR